MNTYRSSALLANYLNKAKKIYVLEKKYEDLEKKAGSKGLIKKLINFYNKNSDFREFIENPLVIIEDDKKRNDHPLKSFIFKKKANLI